MRCAKCPATLTPIIVDKIEVDRCDSCGGIWFDRTELHKILESGRGDELDAKGDVPSDADRLPGSCPRCATGLVRYDSHVIDGLGYDHCGACHGIWLDRGELAHLNDDHEAGKFVAFAADIAHRAVARGRRPSD